MWYRLQSGTWDFDTFFSWIVFTYEALFITFYIGLIFGYNTLLGLGLFYICFTLILLICHFFTRQRLVYLWFTWLFFYNPGPLLYLPWWELSCQCLYSQCNSPEFKIPALLPLFCAALTRIDQNTLCWCCPRSTTQRRGRITGILNPRPLHRLVGSGHWQLNTYGGKYSWGPGGGKGILC